MMKIAAAYIRASTDDQLEYSPDSQLAKTRELARREGYIIPDEYVYQDDGISGKSANKRPAFQLMIGTAKEPEPPWDVIYVWEFSRFARNQEEAILYKNLLKKRGITLKSVREPLSDSPFSSLIERIIEWMDEYYLINLAHEVRRGMVEKASRGEATGAPPFGYSVKDKVLVPNEHADTVRYVFEQYAGGKGQRDLAVELSDMGVRTQRGNMPDLRWVRYILTNETYIGKTRYSREGHANYSRANFEGDNVMVVDGKHEPIIDLELWDKVQARIRARDTEYKYRRPRAKQPRNFMLRGLLRCSSCGATMVMGDIKTGSLQCNRYNRGQCKVSHYTTTAQADEAVIGALRLAIAEKIFTFAPAAPKVTQITRDWDKLIAAEEVRIKRARDAYLGGIFEAAEYAEVKTTAEAEIARLEEARAAETGERKPPDPSAYAAKVADVLEIITSPDVDVIAKNEALRTIIDKVVFDRATNHYDIFFCY